MSDRRRRIRNRRSKRTSPWLVATQLVIMAGVLIFIFAFRDYLATSASNIFSVFDRGDIEVAADAGHSDAEAPASTGRTPRLRVIKGDDAGPDAGSPTSDNGSDGDGGPVDPKDAGNSGSN